MCSHSEIILIDTRERIFPVISGAFDVGAVPPWCGRYGPTWMLCIVRKAASKAALQNENSTAVTLSKL